jgi:hypothetical protein
LFAYGQSGSGKTYTLQGKIDGDDDQAGMIPRLLKDLHQRIAEEESDPRIKYNVRLRFVEVSVVLSLTPSLRASNSLNLLMHVPLRIRALVVPSCA